MEDKKVSDKKGLKEKNKKELIKKSKKYEKQTKISIIIMLVLIVLVLFSHWVIQSMNRFEYNGMSFYKEKAGAIIYYKTGTMNYFPTGFATSGGVPIQLKLRNDPRDLEEISIEGEINLRNLRKETIISLNPNVVNCSDVGITMIDFSRTLTAFGKEVSAGTTDFIYSRENDVPQVTCQQAREKTVIIMQERDEERIVVNKAPFEKISIKNGKQVKTTGYKDCYIIEVNDCRLQQGFERFLLSMMENLIVE